MAPIRSARSLLKNGDRRNRQPFFASYPLEKSIACDGEKRCQFRQSPFFNKLLAAVRHLRKAGARTVSLVGGSFGGVAAARITVDLKPGEIDRLVLLAARPDVPPEKLPGPKLFIVARDDANSAGLRLPGIRAYYEKAMEPKQWMTVDGKAHAQFIFQTDQGDRVMAAILRFLTGK